MCRCRVLSMVLLSLIGLLSWSGYCTALRKETIHSLWPRVYEGLVFVYLEPPNTEVLINTSP